MMKLDTNSWIYCTAMIGMIEYTYITASKNINMYVSKYKQVENHYSTHETLDDKHFNDLFSLIEPFYEDNEDEINNGINYHDMQSRDIVLNDEKGDWCSNLKPDVKANVISAIENQLDTEVELFDGGDIMDRHEKQSNADGIAYNGADAYDSEYAQV